MATQTNGRAKVADATEPKKRHRCIYMTDGKFNRFSGELKSRGLSVTGYINFLAEEIAKGNFEYLPPDLRVLPNEG